MESPSLEVDRYILCEPLAVGGMATVYFARQRGAAGFAKAVVVKRMRPDLVHQREFVELFVDEARLASRVRHANVVSVTDVVASGDELLLVMDYFHGESLSRVVAASGKKPVPNEIAVAIACGVLRGLHAAHEAIGDEGEPLGIVHRDVSPQNILVCADGVARVVDFGIARAAGQLHATDEGKTRGKAGYSAPEQLRGGAVTRKIDVFACAVVLWELLVGCRLFDGETHAAVITAVLTEPIEPPGYRAPSVPEELDEIVMKALDRDPARRFATALDFANALETAVTPASPSAVSGWLQSHCAAELEARAAVVRRLQSARAETPRPAPAIGPVGRAGAVAAQGSSGSAVSPPSSPASQVDLATGSLATSRSATVPPVRSRARPLAVAAAAALFAAGGGALALGVFRPRAETPPVAATAARQPASSSAPTERPNTPESRPPPLPTESAPSAITEPASPSASEVVSRSGTPPPAKRPLRPGPKPAPTPKGAKNCNPPYELDPAGRQIFKVECL